MSCTATAEQNPGSSRWPPPNVLEPLCHRCTHITHDDGDEEYCGPDTDEAVNSGVATEPFAISVSARSTENNNRTNISSAELVRTGELL